METNERLCRDCAMFAEADEDSPPYCMARDLYTFVKSDDEACIDFVRYKYKHED